MKNTLIILFIKECLLFKSKERLNIALGLWTWTNILIIRVFFMFSVFQVL